MHTIPGIDHRECRGALPSGTAPRRMGGGRRLHLRLLRKVYPVSSSDSPFSMLDPEDCTRVVVAPRDFAAISKEERVQVEGSWTRSPIRLSRRSGRV